MLTMNFPNTRYIGKNKWVNLKDYYLYIEHKGLILFFTIYAGFIYDKVSTFPLGSFLTGVERSGAGDLMSLHHDAGYVMKGQMTKGSKIMTCKVFDKVLEKFIPFHGKISRKDLDEMMVHLMHKTNDIHPDEFSKSNIAIHYWAVRLGGWSKWNKKKRPESDFLMPLEELQKWKK